MQKAIAILMAILIIVAAGTITISAITVESPVATQSTEVVQGTTNGIVVDNSAISPATGKDFRWDIEQFVPIVFIILCVIFFAVITLI